MNGRGTIYNDLVTPEVLDRDLLWTIYDAAYMDCEKDSDGDTVISERGLKYVATIHESQHAIYLFLAFGLKDGVPFAEQLEYVNYINDKYIVTRASINKDREALVFDYYIWLNGGISRKAIVLATKKFIEVTGQALLEYIQKVEE